MKRITRCLICDSEGHQLLYPSTFVGEAQDAHRYFLAQRQASAHGEIRRCNLCGFTFTSPQFEEHEYGSIYSRIAAADPNQAVNHGAGALATERRYRRLLRLIERHAPVTEPFLDFGCGDGSFLRVAASRNGKGFEVGESGRRLGPGGCEILSGSFGDIAGTPALPWESQSFVTAFDVFEHLPALPMDLEMIRRVIRPGGKLFITVPDIQSTLSVASGKRWNMLLLEHLWYFSGPTLDRFLSKAGFVPLALKSVAYDASVGHVLKRLGESFGLGEVRVPSKLRDMVVPVPAGIVFGAYLRTD